jgi:Protein of unknown function (DUF3570)
MRLQLIRVRAGVALLAALVVIAPGVSPRARADNHVTVRGAYYREASTRVVQPVVEISQDLPGRFDVTALYLLDAITSASVAAGTTGDTIFTELRNEVGLGAGWTPDWGRLALRYRYSAESDYWSHAVEASGSVRVWGDTGTLGAALGASFDGVWPRTARTPNCPTQDQKICRLQTYFGGVSFTQVLTPTVVVQLSLETAYLDGFQNSLYRAVPNLGYEQVPRTRWRNSATGRAAYYLPRSGTGFQVQYRYYRDDWSVSAHTVEGRIYQTVTRDLEVRASYRYYSQTPANFWCDWMARPDCYGAAATVYTADPKLQQVSTSMPELKVAWEALRWRGVPFFGWFAEGSFEVSYARLFQNTPFGNAHLVQMGYTLPY